jgi:hypothetical protein
MNQILSIPNDYTEDNLRSDRIFPLIDRTLQKLIVDVNEQRLQSDEHNFIDHTMKVMNLREGISRDLFNSFKQEFQTAIETNPANHIVNLNQYSRLDICLGCTQYIDALYMRYGPNGIQVLEQEYNYHGRLNPQINFKTIETLEAQVPLIISQPFYYGTTHKDMDAILDCAVELDIPVHIDGAWITACKNINIDFSHPAIKSFATSMSKGYGLSGWNRIGLRWTKETVEDSITIMNDYIQIPAENVSVGLYFLKNIKPNHLWNKHEQQYLRVCRDFNLMPTDSIHLATKGTTMVGVEAVIRYLEAIDE